MGKEARGVYRGLRAQGAFEYLLSYGWAIIVVVVLGIVLYNLGAFNPSQASVATGFAFLKSLSVVVSPQDSNNAMLVLQVQNAGGREFQVSSTTISTPSANCSYVLNFVQDSSGNTLATSHPFTLSAGQEAKLTYWANGTNCGSLGTRYNYKIGFSGTDSFGMQQTDSGSIRGKPKNCNFPQSGLVGLWHFREGSGTQTVDDSGNGNAGTFVGGSSWVSGKSGYGASFPSSASKYVNITNQTNLNSFQDFSIAAWVKIAANSGNWQTFVGFGANGDEFLLALGYSYYLSFYSSGLSPAYKSVAAVLPLNEWHHVFFERTGPNYAFYIDGQLNASGSWSSTPIAINTAGRHLIGGDAVSENYNGSIDEVTIWNRALSASEIQQAYNCGN